MEAVAGATAGREGGEAGDGSEGAIKWAIFRRMKNSHLIDALRENLDAQELAGGIEDAATDAAHFNVRVDQRGGQGTIVRKKNAKPICVMGDEKSVMTAVKLVVAVRRGAALRSQHQFFRRLHRRAADHHHLVESGACVVAHHAVQFDPLTIGAPRENILITESAGFGERRILPQQLNRPWDDNRSKIAGAGDAAHADGIA